MREALVWETLRECGLEGVGACCSPTTLLCQAVLCFTAIVSFNPSTACALYSAQHKKSPNNYFT